MTANPSPIAIDLSRVPNLDARREAEALFLAQTAAQHAFEDAERAAPRNPDDIAAEAAKDAAWDAFKVAEAAYLAVEPYAPTPEMEAASAAQEAAQDAYSDHPLTIDEDYDADDGIARCALSGLPLLDDDEVITDEETGEKILRCLVLPLRDAGHWPATASDESDLEDAAE